jgi:hypothetical protein
VTSGLGPVTTDHLVAGCVRWLSGLPDITNVIGYDPIDAAPYLYQHKLWTVMEGTQSTAAVIGREGGWTGANLHNTLRFPRLSLEIWCDPLRDAGMNVVDPGEVWRRVDVAWSAFDRRLHRPQGEVQMWGQVRTIAASRLTEPVVYQVPDGDGMLRLLTFYAVTEG